MLYQIQPSLSALSLSEPFSGGDSSHLPFIAPLWVSPSVSPSSFGSIHYRVLSDNSSTINMVQEVIADADPNLANFRPQLCVILTQLDVLFTTRVRELLFVVCCLLLVVVCLTDLVLINNNRCPIKSYLPLMVPHRLPSLSTKTLKQYGT